MEEGQQMDKPLRHLIDIIHFAENVSAKIHGVLDEAEIYRIVREEFAQSKRYAASILLLADDGSKLRIAEASISPRKVKEAEKAAGLRLREYSIDLKRSSIYPQVVRDGKTVKVKARDIMSELLPQPLAGLISKIMGYDDKRTVILTPLRRHGEIIGAFAMSSVELAEHFIPTVRNLAQHISNALDLADENIERKRAEEEILRRGEELVTLNEIGQDIGSTLNLNRVLKLVAQKTAQICNVERCSVLLLDKDKEELVPMMSQFASGATDAELWRIFREETYAEKVDEIPVIGEVIRESRTVVLDQESKSRLPQRWTEPFGIKSLLLVPLLSKDETIGLMALDYTTENRSFSAEQVNLAATIGRQVAIAIENASLYQEEMRRVFEMEALRRTTLDITSQLDVPQLLHSIVQRAAALARTTRGGLYLYHPEQEELELVVSHRLDKDYTGTRLKAGEGLSGKVVQIGQPLIVEDYTAWEGRSEKYEGSPFRAVMAVPLKWGQKIVGVLNVTDVEKPRAFSEHDLWLLELFANQAAIAIENARLYEGLRESEERYRTYVENVAEAIWETDSEGHFTYWSPQVENLTGYAPEELLGHTAYELLTHPDDVEEFRNRIRQMVEEGREKFTLTYQVLHRDGSILHIETSISPVRNDAGEVIKFQGVARDVSERIQLQAQLIQSAKLSGIGQMISGVAHELNNPLTTIMGYAQLLQVSDADESIKEDLQIIYNDALRAQRIVQNLLTFARQKKPQRSPVDINEIIERTLALRSYQLKMDNVEVVTQLVENLPWTMADDYQLQQVFLNIINNAYQAMVHGKGGGILTIRSGLPDNDTILVSFTDTGPGIPSDILDKVFDPFFTTKDVGTGTGLGLSVSHGIIQEHGGRIWAESQAGQGATFFIELPVKSWLEDISLAPLDEESEQMPSEGHRILVIDDERSIVSLIVRVLKESGYQIDGVTSAQLALKKLHQERYDLIISDIRMPDMDGPTCEEQVRATDPALAKRIIFITGDLLNPTTQAFLETWEGRSISKPFDVEELRALVTEALS